MEGGSTITQQLVKQTLLQTATTRRSGGGDRVQHRPQAPRGPAGAGPGGEVLEVGDPHPLPEPRVLRRGRLRHPGRRPALLQRQRRRPDAAAGGDARRAGADPVRDDPITQPEHAANRRNQVLQRMLPSGTSPPRSSPTISPQPGGRRAVPAPPHGCVGAVQGAFFCDYLQRYLTQTLGSPRTAGQRRPDHQDDAAAGPAGARGPGGAQPPGDGRPAGRDVHRGRTGHRPRAGDERQPPVRLRPTTRPRSRWRSTSPPARAPARRTRSSSPPPPSSRASRRGTHHRPAIRTPRGSTRSSAARSGRPTSSQKRRLPADATTWRGAGPLGQHLLRRASRTQLGSVEGPVRMAQRMGLFSDRPGHQHPAE